jgi:hypothetical protein
MMLTKCKLCGTEPCYPSPHIRRVGRVRPELGHSEGSRLTSAQRVRGGGQGLAVAAPLAQAALQLPQLLLLLQGCVLPLPTHLPAEVLLRAQPPGCLGDLELQGQLALQAAQGVLRDRAGVRPRTHSSPDPWPEAGGPWGIGQQHPGTRDRGWSGGKDREPIVPMRSYLQSLAGWNPSGILSLLTPKGWAVSPMENQGHSHHREGRLGPKPPLPPSFID